MLRTPESRIEEKLILVGRAVIDGIGLTVAIETAIRVAEQDGARRTCSGTPISHPVFVN
jgi:hypothetical protein